MVSERRVAQLGLMACLLVLTLSMSVLLAGTLKAQPLQMDTKDEATSAMPQDSPRIALMDLN